MKILIIEDELKIADFIGQVIKEMGHEVVIASTGAEARSQFSQSPIDLVILDVMLPDDDGKKICRDFKALKSQVPILMLTALSRIEDKVAGLDSGADDYLTKPFSADEMSARIRALFRRHTERPLSLKCGDLELDVIKRQAIRSGAAIRLTTKEYALLEYFLKNIGRPLSRSQIAEHVWDLQFDPESNVVDVYVNHLRKKVDAGSSKKLIKTIVGQGYVLNEE